jgi:hypothetical protein
MRRRAHRSRFRSRVPHMACLATGGLLAALAALHRRNLSAPATYAIPRQETPSNVKTRHSNECRWRLTACVRRARGVVFRISDRFRVHPREAQHQLFVATVLDLALDLDHGRRMFNSCAAQHRLK